MLGGRARDVLKLESCKWHNHMSSSNVVGKRNELRRPRLSVPTQKLQMANESG